MQKVHLIFEIISLVLFVICLLCIFFMKSYLFIPEILLAKQKVSVHYILSVASHHNPSNYYSSLF